MIASIMCCESGGIVCFTRKRESRKTVNINDNENRNYVEMKEKICARL